MATKAKEAAGKKAAELIENGMTVGLGTGSTASHFIRALGARCREGLSIQAVATSVDSENLAKQMGIPLTNLHDLTSIDIDVDGADEIDPKKRMIKGGGGALFREKIIAGMSKEMIVIVDPSKQVDAFGKFPLPVEISPFAYKATLHHLHSFGYQGTMRKNSENQHFVTDNGNYIYDIQLSYPCTKPEEVERQISGIPGVIETGFFLGMAGRVIIGQENGQTITLD